MITSLKIRRKVRKVALVWLNKKDHYGHGDLCNYLYSRTEKWMPYERSKYLCAEWEAEKCKEMGLIEDSSKLITMLRSGDKEMIDLAFGVIISYKERRLNARV